MEKNVKKCQKITNNCKISEITKYGEKMKTIYKNLKQCKKGQKTGLKRPKNGQISDFFLSSFFWLETTSKNGTSRFHTMFGYRDTHFR